MNNHIKKYLCMKAGDNFVTEDEEDAFEHVRIGSEHHVLEVEWEDGRSGCRPIEAEIPLELGVEEEGY